MQHTLKLAARSAAIALVVGLGAGCATNGDLDEVREIATKAQTEARAARTAAESNQGAEAAAAAAEAQRTADAAQACCNETNDKLDRAWHKGMQK